MLISRGASTCSKKQNAINIVNNRVNPSPYKACAKSVLLLLQNVH